ncbi:hypothetical protein Tco_1252685 [Tanacetum coccineum]
MTTLADKAILSGADNRPPMLEKDMYDSWKSIMELYMMNRQHGRMILESVENGPLIWPSIEENGVTRPKKYSELSATEAIQADCDIKATNIILQGLPPEVYALVSNHKVAKELWERIQLLMQGTSLTKQERECKLYDEFDKFAYRKGETLCDFYLRFSLLLNDMNIYNMKLEQFQVNTKFLNTLPPEWSKFVTDVKLVQDLHITNIDQLHAYLGQHEFHANEVCLMHERNSDPLALVATHQMTQSPYQTHQHSYQNFNQQQPEFPQLDLGLTVLVFKQGDDPIDAINHMMSFLSVVVTSHYPTTNNRLMNSLNPRQQATINDGRVTLQPEQVESFWETKGLLFVTTAKGKGTCPNSALNLKGNKMIHGLRIKRSRATTDYHYSECAYQSADDLDLAYGLLTVMNSTLPKFLSWGIYLIMVQMLLLRSSKLFSVKFRNDHVEKILGYSDYQIGNVTILRVYYMDGLEHNLFSVGQLCDSNLEVTFRQHTCFIHNLEGIDLLTGSRGNNLYTLSLGDTMASSHMSLVKGLKD